MLYGMLFMSIILVLLYIFVEVKSKDPLWSIFFKAFASLGFILLFTVAIYQRLTDNMVVMLQGNMLLEVLPTALFFLMGLVCGLIGDLLLALRPLQEQKEDKKIINYGITAFALGHLFYLGGLLTLSKFSILSIIVGVLMMVIIMVGSKVLKFDMGITRIPSYFYALLIFMMVGQSIGFASQYDFNQLSLLIMIGAILFAISDLILSPIYYKGEKRSIFIIFNLLTYYGAQVIIAFSMFYII